MYMQLIVVHLSRQSRIILIVRELNYNALT